MKRDTPSTSTPQDPSEPLALTARDVARLLRSLRVGVRARQRQHQRRHEAAEGRSDA